MKKIKENKLLILILLIAFTVRFIGVSEYPVGFTQDEAGIGYDAYCLLKTGKDTWGKVLPLTLRSFGDFKLPLYSYLAIPSVFLFGLNEFSIRLPGVIFGVLAVLATYLMVEKLSKDKKLSLWSALFLALSPWHIPLSRGAFEANLTTFFIPMGVYCFYKGLKNKKWMNISALMFGINLFSYHSARLITPLIMVGLAYFNRDHFMKGSLISSVKKTTQKYAIYLLIFFVFIGLVALTMLKGANNRALDITIFNPTDGWLAMSQKRFFIITQGLGASIARLFVNKPIFILDQFIRKYFQYLSPQFLFTEGIADWNYGMIPGKGVLYLFELLAVSIGIIAFAQNRAPKRFGFIVFWLLVAPLAASLTKGGAAGTRAAVMMPAIQILSAFGVVYLGSLLKTKIRRVLNFSVSFLLIIAFTNFLVHFVYYSPTQAAEAMQTSRKEMAEYLDEIDENYEMVRVSRSLGVPHIWMMFYQKWDPEVVQESSKDWLVYQEQDLVSIDQYDGYELGNYIFGNIYYENRLREENTLFVGRPEDFPGDVKPVKIVENSKGEPSVYIVESID